MNQRWQMLAFEPGGRWVHNNDSFDHIPQFAHIAWPCIAHERINGVIANLANAAAISSRKLLQKVARQQRNILLALAQRWHRKRDDVKTVKQILTKVSSRDFFF